MAFGFDIPNSISFEFFFLQENLSNMKVKRGGDLRDLYNLYWLYEFAAYSSN